MILHALTSLFAAAFAFSYLDLSKGFADFSWHPIFMLISFGLCMSSALYFQKVKRQNRWHIFFQFLSAIASGYALYVIWGIKNSYGKAHIQTYHSYVGIVVLGLQFVTFSFSFLMGVILGQRAHPIHPIQGKFIYVLGIATLCSGYYKTNEDNIVKLVLFGGFALLAILAFLFEKPVRQMQQEFKDSKKK